MSSCPLLLIDAFTRQPYCGNPCAVVLRADDLSAVTMQTIAREMNLSETAFVMESKIADARARYFTPAEEIPFAGHPTIATVFALLSIGQIDNRERARIELELPGGIIPVDIAGEEGIQPLMTMSQKKPEFLRTHDRRAVAAAFGLTEADLRPDAPVMTVSTGTPQLMVPLTSLSSLRKASLQIDKYRTLKANGDFFSPHLFVAEGVTQRGQTFARHFGLPPDVLEDPFTGSATGGMAAYLWRHRLLTERSFLAEQGHWMGRPGEARVEVVGPPDSIEAIRVGGHAVKVMEGEIEIHHQASGSQIRGAERDRSNTQQVG